MRGGDRGISHKSELHVRMCDRRLEEQAVVLRTADEHYDYAITLINERKLPAARQHLMKGLEQQPEADHIYYALALCDGLSGDLHGACENLKRAIEIQPRNRIAARQDADFAGLPINRRSTGCSSPKNSGGLTDRSGAGRRRESNP